MKSKKLNKFLGKEQELPKKEINSDEIEQIDEKNIDTNKNNNKKPFHWTKVTFLDKPFKRKRRTYKMLLY